jgi:hypothetical protein
VIRASDLLHAAQAAERCDDTSGGICLGAVGKLIIWLMLNLPDLVVGISA